MSRSWFYLTFETAVPEGAVVSRIRKEIVTGTQTGKTVIQKDGLRAAVLQATREAETVITEKRSGRTMIKQRSEVTHVVRSE